MINKYDSSLSYVVGAILGVVGLFASGFLKEFFGERARKAKHKRNVARHVLKICIEASTNNFLLPPREMEDIYSAITDLEGIDKKMGAAMEKFISSWYFIKEHQRSNSNHDDAKFLKENLDRVERERKVLVTWANKIRTGSSIREYISTFLHRIR